MSDDDPAGATAAITLRDLDVVYAGDRPGVRGVSLTVARGRSIALVGESGSGKSTLARAIAGLLPGHARVSGEHRVAGRTAYMPQDAMGALHPLRRVSWQISQVLGLHGVPRAERASRAADVLRRAGVPDPTALMSRYPHELSGGLAQRVVLATVLAVAPTVLIADEPTSALDVTTQARVLEMFRELVEREGITLVLITHDLRAAARIADTVAVLFRGELVESGPTSVVLGSPRHEYTAALARAAAADPQEKDEEDV